MSKEVGTDPVAIHVDFAFSFEHDDVSIGLAIYILAFPGLLYISIGLLSCTGWKACNGKEAHGVKVEAEPAN